MSGNRLRDEDRADFGCARQVCRNGLGSPGGPAETKGTGRKAASTSALAIRHLKQTYATGDDLDLVPGN